MNQLRFGIALLACGTLPLLAQSEPTPTPTPVAAEKLVLVVAAQAHELPENHYLWAAEMAASRLKGKTSVLEGGLNAALRRSRENPGTTQGIIEVIIDVYSYKEEVRISCFDPAGRELWKEKAKANMGGNEEALARKMFERAIQKAEKHTACGI
jgi:hypothetical protein